MFSCFTSLLPIAALVVVVTAAPSALQARAGCSGGDLYCCNQSFSGTTPVTGILGGLLSAVVGANVEAGLACDPITVIGLGNGAQCTEQTACCTGNTQNGLVNLECTPVNVNV